MAGVSLAGNEGQKQNGQKAQFGNKANVPLSPQYMAYRVGGGYIYYPVDSKGQRIPGAKGVYEKPKEIQAKPLKSTTQVALAEKLTTDLNTRTLKLFNDMSPSFEAFVTLITAILIEVKGETIFNENFLIDFTNFRDVVIEFYWTCRYSFTKEQNFYVYSLRKFQNAKVYIFALQNYFTESCQAKNSQIECSYQNLVKNFVTLFFGLESGNEVKQEISFGLGKKYKDVFYALGGSFDFDSINAKLAFAKFYPKYITLLKLAVDLSYTYKDHEYIKSIVEANKSMILVAQTSKIITVKTTYYYLFDSNAAEVKRILTSLQKKMAKDCEAKSKNIQEMCDLLTPNLGFVNKHFSDSIVDNTKGGYTLEIDQSRNAEVLQFFKTKTTFQVKNKFEHMTVEQMIDEFGGMRKNKKVVEKEGKKKKEINEELENDFQLYINEIHKKPKVENIDIVLPSQKNVKLQVNVKHDHKDDSPITKDKYITLGDQTFEIEKDFPLFKKDDKKVQHQPVVQKITLTHEKPIIQPNFIHQKPNVQNILTVNEHKPATKNIEIEQKPLVQMTGEGIMHEILNNPVYNHQPKIQKHIRINLEDQYTLQDPIIPKENIAKKQAEEDRAILDRIINRNKAHDMPSIQTRSMTNDHKNDLINKFNIDNIIGVQPHPFIKPILPTDDVMVLRNNKEIIKPTLHKTIIDEKVLPINKEKNQDVTPNQKSENVDEENEQVIIGKTKNTHVKPSYKDDIPIINKETTNEKTPELDQYMVLRNGKVVERPNKKQRTSEDSLEMSQIPDEEIKDVNPKNIIKTSKDTFDVVYPHEDDPILEELKSSGELYIPLQKQDKQKKPEVNLKTKDEIEAEAQNEIRKYFKENVVPEINLRRKEENEPKEIEVPAHMNNLKNYFKDKIAPLINEKRIEFNEEKKEPSHIDTIKNYFADKVSPFFNKKDTEDPSKVLPEVADERYADYDPFSDLPQMFNNKKNKEVDPSKVLPEVGEERYADHVPLINTPQSNMKHVTDDKATQDVNPTVGKDQAIVDLVKNKFKNDFENKEDIFKPPLIRIHHPPKPKPKHKKTDNNTQINTNEIINPINEKPISDIETKINDSNKKDIWKQPTIVIHHLPKPKPKKKKIDQLPTTLPNDGFKNPNGSIISPIKNVNDDLENSPVKNQDEFLPNDVDDQPHEQTLPESDPNKNDRTKSPTKKPQIQDQFETPIDQLPQNNPIYPSDNVAPKTLKEALERDPDVEIISQRPKSFVPEDDSVKLTDSMVKMFDSQNDIIKKVENDEVEPSILDKFSPSKNIKGDKIPNTRRPFEELEDEVEPSILDQYTPQKNKKGDDKPNKRKPENIDSTLTEKDLVPLFSDIPDYVPYKKTDPKSQHTEKDLVPLFSDIPDYVPYKKTDPKSQLTEKDLAPLFSEIPVHVPKNPAVPKSELTEKDLVPLFSDIPDTVPKKQDTPQSHLTEKDLVPLFSDIDDSVVVKKPKIKRQIILIEFMDCSDCLKDLFFKKYAKSQR